MSVNCITLNSMDDIEKLFAILNETIGESDEKAWETVTEAFK